jgi:N-acetylneuraminic acid mutarotase
MRRTAIAILVVFLLARATRAGEAKAEVTEGPALPFGIAAHAGGVVRGKPFVAGGSSWSADKTTKRRHAESFVFSDGKWAPGPALPQGLSNLAYGCDYSGLYVAGGTDGQAATRDVLRLADVGGDAKWEKLAPLPDPVESAAGAVRGGVVYVAGGFTNGKSSNRVFTLDVTRADAKWKECAPLPAHGRAYAALVPLGEFLYLLGGYAGPPADEKTEVFGDAWRYDPAADKWERLEGFDLPGFGWCAVPVDDSHVMLAGRIDGDNRITDDVWLVDVRSPDKPVAIAKLVTATCCATPARVAPDTWWFIAGEPDVGKSRTPRVSVVKVISP